MCAKGVLTALSILLFVVATLGEVTKIKIFFQPPPNNGACQEAYKGLLFLIYVVIYKSKSFWTLLWHRS